MLITKSYQASILVIIGGYLSGQIAGNLNLYVKELRRLYPKAIIPPDYVFPIVWTILYYLYGRFLYFVWVSTFLKRNLIFGLGIAGLVLNYLWTPIFLKNRKLALIIICLQILITIITLYYLKQEIDTHKLKLINGIYLSWLTFALLLNYQVTR